MWVYARHFTLVGNCGDLLGILEIIILSYAFLHSAIGIGKGALSMNIVGLPFTDVFSDPGIGKGTKTIRPGPHLYH